MNRPRAGFTLIEMLIVVTIIAVLSGVGYSYYGDSLLEAREATVRTNLAAVRDAISRYFKDNMAYPTSLEALVGPYLQQPVNTLLITPLAGDAKVKVEVSNVPETNIFQVLPVDCVWIDYVFGGAGSGGKQMRSIKIEFNGTIMPW